MATIDPNLPPKVDATQIGQTQTLPIPSATKVDPSVYTGVISQMASASQASTDAQKAEQDAIRQAQSQSKDIATLQSQMGGQEADRANLYQTGGVNSSFNRLQDINAQLQALNTEATKIPLQTGQAYQGSTGTQSGIQSVNRDLLQRNALASLTFSQQAAVEQANYTKAKNLADQAVDIKYAQTEAEIKSRQTQLQALQDFTLTPAQKRSAEAQKRVEDLKAQEIEEKKATEKQLNTLFVQASSQGAPQELLTKAQNAKTPMEMAKILGAYAGDFYKTALLKQQIETEKAQRAKIYTDIAKTQAETGAVVNATTKAEADSWVSNISSGKAKISDVPTKLKGLVSLGLATTAISSPEVKAKIEASQSTYNLANELLTLEGKGGAVGAGIGKTIGAIIPGYDGTAFAGTDRANYEAKFQQLKDTLASANLDKLKGAMSDKDIEFLRNTGSALSLSMPEDRFDEELKKVAATMAKIPGVQAMKVPNKFQQATGATTPVTGSVIINKVDDNGSIDFKLP